MQIENHHRWINYPLIENTYRVIFLHESLGSVVQWRNFPDQLSQMAGLPCLVYDRDGYGKSTKPIGKRDNQYMHREAEKLYAIIEKTGALKAFLYGHSDGASIAAICAAQHPERVAAVVLEGVHVVVEEITLQGIREFKESFTDETFRKLEKYHGSNTQGVLDAWWDTWLDPEFRDWDITRLLPRITAPVLVIQGENDPYGSCEQVRLIREFSGAPVSEYILAGTGHSPHKEKPALVLEQVSKFFREAGAKPS